MFKYMFRLGTYAREFELTLHMTCVNFDMAPVLAVEKAIKEWRPPQYNDLDVDFMPDTACLPDGWDQDPVQEAHYIQDLYHCAQAWRLALLVYIERVFKWRRGEASLTRISLFARKALNNVFSCRRSVMIQKQLLLPIFLTACETDDEDLRQKVRDYCSWWGGKTRYDMFITTLGLLQEVWAAEADPDVWWGSLIDQKSGVSSTRQYLFG
jgi:Fungal specific transcription factor domain